MLSPLIPDEIICGGKRNQVKNSSLLKEHDTEEEKSTSSSHPTDKSSGGEDFLATQAANAMESDY